MRGSDPYLWTGTLAPRSSKALLVLPQVPSLGTQGHWSAAHPMAGLGKLRQGGGCDQSRVPRVFPLERHSTLRCPSSQFPNLTAWHSTAPQVPSVTAHSPQVPSTAQHPEYHPPPARAAPQGAPTRHCPHPIPLSCHPCHPPGRTAAAPAGNAEARPLVSQMRPGAATPVLALWHCLQHQCHLRNPGLMESPWKGTHDFLLQLERPRAQLSESSARAHTERDPRPWCCSFGDVLGT